MVRIALGIEYDGSAYAGWQQQSHAPSVQAELQRALAGVATHEVTLTAAGRTDAGVHALMQVAHFDTSAVRPEHAWSLGATAQTAADVTVLWAREVPEHFHARHAALSPTYIYRILNWPMFSSLFIACLLGPPPIDASAMHVAAQSLIGEHDFTSFRAAECQSATPMRRVQSVTIERGRRDRRDHRARQRVPAPHGAQHRGIPDPGRRRRTACRVACACTRGP